MKERFIVNALCTYNNTHLVLRDTKGKTYYKGSGGTVGMKGARRRTGLAASLIVQELVKKAKELGVDSVDVILKGFGPGRFSVVKVLLNQGLRVDEITHANSQPHNGCRPKKGRRL